MVGGELAKISDILNLVEEQRRDAIITYKKTAPEFRRTLKNLFLLNLDIETVTSEFIILVMDYAKYPQRAEGIIKSIMSTKFSMETTLEDFEDAKHFPELYPWNLERLRSQFKKLKDLWVTKAWKLITITEITTRVDTSTLSILHSANISGGGDL